jgi:hypothetical protein
VNVRTTGRQAVGITWGGDQPSDFWSLRTLVAATLTAAATGFSNWSHDVGGYLGERLVARASKELLARWVQFGCFTPLMHAHSRFEQEPWTYDDELLDLNREHERLVPYIAPPRSPRDAPACRSSGRSRSPIPPTRAAGRSRTRTASARRCGSRPCSKRAPAASTWISRAATGSTCTAGATCTVGARWTRTRR